MKQIKAAITAHKPNRRTTVKILHGVTIPLFVWFMIVTPDDVNRIGRWAFHLHSFLGLIFVSFALFWTVTLTRKGLVGRAGPKLSAQGKRLHPIMHKTLIWGLFGVALTGFGLGVTSTTQLWAGSIVPIGLPFDLPRWNAFVGDIHIYEFYALAALAICHAAFHIWRHLRLKDNALRIMAPRALHRFL